jgi:hypothetical protein
MERHEILEAMSELKLYGIHPISWRPHCIIFGY